MSGTLLIFGGTTEGRRLCEVLSTAGRKAEVFIATDYGAALLRGLPGITVRVGRLDAAAMTAVIRAASGAAVIDATHPYARDVTLNIVQACAETGAEYIRVLREERNLPGVGTVENTAAAAAFLSGVEGNALLCTGSKELIAFCRVPDYRNRLYARVLPTAEVLRHCAELGFDGSHVIAMQGPFSHDLNVAMLRHCRCRYLVTKNTGTAGGMDEKISAARETGAELVIIDRPLDETGLSLEDVLVRLGLGKEERS